MGMSQRWHTRGEVAAAIIAAAGNLSQAARDLGVSRQAVKARVARDALLRRTVRRARVAGAVVDVCAACGGTGVTR